MSMSDNIFLNLETFEPMKVDAIRPITPPMGNGAVTTDNDAPTRPIRRVKGFTQIETGSVHAVTKVTGKSQQGWTRCKGHDGLPLTSPEGRALFSHDFFPGCVFIRVVKKCRRGDGDQVRYTHVLSSIGPARAETDAMELEATHATRSPKTSKTADAFFLFEKEFDFVYADGNTGQKTSETADELLYFGI